MRLMRSLAAMLIVVAGTSGCGTLYTQDAAYLESARGQATQSDVRQKLGEPTMTTADADGSTIWLYEKREQQSGNRFTAPGTWCEQYLLTFDHQSVLRSWNHREHFHGGEIMPAECIPAAERAKSSSQ